MCQGGQVRSVGLKYRLTYHHGHEVLACGWESNSTETIEMLCKWADVIIIMQPQFEKYIPISHHTNDKGERKLFCYDVGEDRFGSAFHSDLQNILETMIQKHKLFLKK